MRLPFAAACRSRRIFVALESAESDAALADLTIARLADVSTTDAPLPRNQRAKLTHRPTDKSPLRIAVFGRF
jgi:hypothetical protein